MTVTKSKMNLRSNKMFGKMLDCFVVLLLLSDGCQGFSTVSLSNATPRPISAGTRPRHRSISQLQAVKFYYSPSSLQHLSKLEEPKDTQAHSLSTASWSIEKTMAVGGALVGAALLGWIGLELTDRNDIYFFVSGLGGALGWTLGGGANVRKSELPADGGSDAQFVMDRPSRLKSILQQVPAHQLQQQDEKERDMTMANKYVELVHGTSYLEYLQDAVEDAKTSGRLRRLVPSYARTLIDQYSYHAAMDGVADWIRAVDHSGFALVRPPTHHACKERGMGGCLLNGAAVAAKYALQKYDRVAILDIDAHYGNGIAHCIQDEPRIKYCSLHEDLTKKNGYMLFQQQDPQDPRSPKPEDMGPLGNCLNVLVPTGATWEEYKELLVDKGLPFLQETDFLIVAAGFDALDADPTSGLCLSPENYRELGLLLKEKFGKNRIAFGLEGGYCWENGDLASAVLNLVNPFA